MSDPMLPRRLDILAGKIRKVISNEDLSAQGQAIAIAMLVTTSLPDIESAVKALHEGER